MNEDNQQMVVTMVVVLNRMVKILNVNSCPICRSSSMVSITSAHRSLVVCALRLLAFFFFFAALTRP
jgi:hypothetical protein